MPGLTQSSCMSPCRIYNDCQLVPTQLYEAPFASLLKDKPESRLMFVDSQASGSIPDRSIGNPTKPYPTFLLPFKVSVQAHLASSPLGYHIPFDIRIPRSSPFLPISSNPLLAFNSISSLISSARPSLSHYAALYTQSLDEKEDQNLRNEQNKITSQKPTTKRRSTFTTRTIRNGR
jgi:hypothetical protein